VSKNRNQTWLALIVAAVGLLLAAILGLWAYMSATATPLHQDPRDVPSVTHSVPLRQWADAVEQGRQIVRAGLIEQNLPGLSVAVGAGGDIVWAEGFGWADFENQVTSRDSRRIPATARKSRPRSTIPASRDPAHSCPPRPTWCASVWRSTAAGCCSPPRSNYSRRHSD
jgi:hypothetical protein